MTIFELFIMIALITLLVIPVVNEQAQSGELFNELVVDSPLAIATESDVGVIILSDNFKL